MAFFRGKKTKPPAELVRATKDALLLFEKPAPAKSVDKANEDISKLLESMKIVFYGDGESEPSQDQIVHLSNEIYSNDLIPLLVKNLAKVDFEARKDIVLIYNHLLRRQIGSRQPTVEYVQRNPLILEQLMQGFESPDIVLACGAMVRDSAKHEALCKLIFSAPYFWNFFRYVESPNFDVSSDALSTFKEVLTAHKAMAAEFLESNYDRFFRSFHVLLHSENYVTKRQSLKLLGELLLDRANFNVMTKFIGSSTNLKLMMNLLRDKSKNIQFEAFHVFKVFIANPNKTKLVHDILLRNKERLVTYLSTFQNEKEEEQFNEEKAFLIKQIKALV